MTLWDFAVAFYDQPGVAPACLGLQDRCDADVVGLMFAAWTGFELGVRMTPEDFAQARRHVQAWRDHVVIPLRQVRREMKGKALSSFHPSSSPLRDKLKALELEAEKLQLEALEGWAATRFPGNAAQASATLGLDNMGAFLQEQMNMTEYGAQSAISRELVDGLRRLEVGASKPI
ncbi:MAG: TIGR02444 family protein [Burkholderiaceae bacterium]|nr:TIGR02444 family protein [Burkholderiaceae bacterium]MDO9089704.1 TIGR02444 family protein [Burkholderiaceae bacterium]